MSATEVLDDYEAGELSVEFEGLEPWEVLEWAIERFGETGCRPACTLLGVTRLAFPELLVEIEATAVA